MSELAEKILLELDKNEKLESLKFASQLSIDHQVGCAKSKSYCVETVICKTSCDA